MQNNNIPNNNRIARNTIFLYVRMLFVMLVSIYTTRIILNTLGVEDYGIYNVVGGFVYMFAFFNTSLSNATQRYYNFYKAGSNEITVNEVFNVSFRIQILFSIVVFILLEVIGLWYINNIMVMDSNRLHAANCVFQCSAISLVLVFIQVPFSSAIMAYERMDFYAYVSMVDTVLKLLSALLLSYLPGDKLICYGLLVLLISTFTFIAYLVYCKLNFEEIRFKGNFNHHLSKKMLVFSGWNMFDMFAYLMKNQGVNLLMNVYFGPVVNAARGIASQVCNAINGFSTNISVAFRPQLVESYASKDLNRTRKMMYSMSKACFFFLLILSVPVIAEIGFILNFWLDGIVPEYTIPFTILVFGDLLISSLNFPLSQTAIAIGELKIFQMVRSFLILSSLPLSWFVLSLGANPTSVFVVNLIIVLLNQPISMYLLHRIFYYDYKEYIREVLIPCFLLSILVPILPFSIVLCMPSSLFRLIICVCLSIPVSVILIYYFGLSKSEKILFIKLIRKLQRNIYGRIDNK